MADDGGEMCSEIVIPFVITQLSTRIRPEREPLVEDAGERPVSSVVIR